jgi:hypothetical protein
MVSSKQYISDSSLIDYYPFRMAALRQYSAGNGYRYGLCGRMIMKLGKETSRIMG